MTTLYQVASAKQLHLSYVSDKALVWHVRTWGTLLTCSLRFAYASLY